MKINLTGLTEDRYFDHNTFFTYAKTDDIANVLRGIADGHTELHNDAASGQYVEAMYAAVRALDRLHEVGQNTSTELVKG